MVLCHEDQSSLSFHCVQIQMWSLILVRLEEKEHTYSFAVRTFGCALETFQSGTGHVDLERQSVWIDKGCSWHSHTNDRNQFFVEPEPKRFHVVFWTTHDGQSLRRA